MASIKILVIILSLFVIPLSAYSLDEEGTFITSESSFGDGLRMYIVNTNSGVPNSEPITSGGQIRVSVGVQNTGTEPLTNGIITMHVPPNFIDMISSECTITDSLMSCTVGDLAPSQSFHPQQAAADRALAGEEAGHHQPRRHQGPQPQREDERLRRRVGWAIFRNIGK